MRILHCVSSIDPKAGGPAVAVAGWAAAQAKTADSVRVLSLYRLGEDESAARRLGEQGVSVERIGPCHGPLARHPDLHAIVERHVAQADVIHLHGLWEEIQFQAAWASRRYGKPYVISPHGMLTRWSLHHSRLKKRLYMAWRLRKMLHGAVAVHFTSETERDESAAVVKGLKTLVIPLGVDLSEFQTLPARGQFRVQFGIAPDRPMIVFLGRIHPGKGLEYLVPALARMKNTTAMLVVVGPDSQGYQAAVEREVERLGLRQRIVFTGMLAGADRIPPLVDADLFCLPSDHENFGLSVVEAMAAGTPVVISDQVNIHTEIAAAGVGGVVPTEVEPLATALNDWLGDNAKRQAAAAKARPFVWARYGWRRIAERWAEHYQRLVGVNL